MGTAVCESVAGICDEGVSWGECLFPCCNDPLSILLSFLQFQFFLKLMGFQLAYSSNASTWSVDLR